MYFIGALKESVWKQGYLVCKVVFMVCCMVRDYGIICIFLHTYVSIIFAYICRSGRPLIIWRFSV